MCYTMAQDDNKISGLAARKQSYKPDAILPATAPVLQNQYVTAVNATH